MTFRLLPLAALLASCATVPPPDKAPGSCPAMSTSNWRAWINAMPGPQRPQLIVTGDVTVPTGGYAMALRLGPTLRNEPPTQHVVLELTPPSGPATQAVTTREVRGSWPALPRYGSVVIRCGGDLIAEISPVETAH